MITIKTNPFKPVDYNESAIIKALKEDSYLIAETKYDGIRGNILVSPEGSIRFLTRTSKPIPALEHLETNVELRESLKELLRNDKCVYSDIGFMIDCELMVHGESFYESVGILRTKWADSKRTQRFNLQPRDLVVRVFSILPLTGIAESAGEIDIPTYLSALHASLYAPIIENHLSPIDIQQVEHKEIYNMEDLMTYYEYVRKRGYEGLVVKAPSCVYKRGKKVGWWKMKPNDSTDGKVTGLVWGTEGLANEGLVIGFEVELESGVTVAATGLTQAQKEEVTNKVLLEDPAYYNGWVCEVSYMEETPDGLLRHPNFKRWRSLEDGETEKV